MPGIDELELRRRLCAQALLADIPVVLAKPFTFVALRQMAEQYAR